MKSDNVNTEPQGKRPYEPPKLVVHGDVRSITGQVASVLGPNILPGDLRPYRQYS